MKKLYRWNGSFGRMGDLTSLFVATEKDIENIQACGEVYFGEVLGKHSDISVDFSDQTFEEITDEQKVIKILGPYLPIGIDILGYAEEKIYQLENSEVAE